MVPKENKQRTGDASVTSSIAVASNETPVSEVPTPAACVRIKSAMTEKIVEYHSMLTSQIAAGSNEDLALADADFIQRIAWICAFLAADERYLQLLRVVNGRRTMKSVVLASSIRFISWDDIAATAKYTSSYQKVKKYEGHRPDLVHVCSIITNGNSWGWEYRALNLCMIHPCILQMSDSMAALDINLGSDR
ncbi:uncharacterized protein N7511_003102 [Penicillium nucicola]|uniref:uncharacterized protein n=1 Tax=Penicillium nucicola TaxID=1850975 RepID=UPI002545A398|nr:uncharacterized protein N7511_003102 [Penicillium nucicola]KAJ5771051.1 hypothetical protein N7511_003102 [Penicillium nucicola]